MQNLKFERNKNRDSELQFVLQTSRTTRWLTAVQSCQPRCCSTWWSPGCPCRRSSSFCRTSLSGWRAENMLGFRIRCGIRYLSVFRFGSISRTGSVTHSLRQQTVDSRQKKNRQQAPSSRQQTADSRQNRKQQTTDMFSNLLEHIIIF